MVSIDADAFDEALQAQSKEAAKEAAGRWFSRANDVLLSAGDDLEYEVFPVVQSAQPPTWDEGEGAFVMRWPHVAAPYFEHGTTAHEVEANEAEVLAFEWPEMANEQYGDTGMTFKEVFSDTWPTVFFPKTEPSGIARIGYNQRGKQAAERWLKQTSDL